VSYFGADIFPLYCTGFNYTCKDTLTNFLAIYNNALTLELCEN